MNELIPPPVHPLLDVQQMNFRGPLALLLELIRKHRLDVHSIRLAEICDPYLAYLKGMEEIDLEIAVEFLDLASTLLLIKSRRLIPRLEEALEAEDAPDPEEALRRQLIQYQRFQEVAQALNLRSLLGRDQFPRPFFEEEAGQLQLHFDLSVYGLLQAFRQALKRQSYVKPHEIEHESKSIEQKIIEVLQVMQPGMHLDFYDLVAKETAKEEVILAFMAILELAKLNVVTLTQTDQFHPIHILVKDRVHEYRDIFQSRGLRIAGVERGFLREGSKGA